MPPLPDTIRELAAHGLADSTNVRLSPGLLPISAKTASYTILPSDKTGTVFTNRGAAGAVTFTLPAPTAVPAGTFYDFVGIADQNIIVATATADTLVALNDAAADSIAMSTSMQKIGGAMRFINDGTAWVGFGMAVGVTFTVAT